MQAPRRGADTHPSVPSRPRRRVLAVLAAAPLAGAAGCATWPGQEPLRVSLVGLESVPGEGLELRFIAKIRVLNPNDAPVDFDGAFVDLEIRGSSFATGVTDQRGSVPRFGEALISIPVTVSGLTVVRQVIGFAAGDSTKVSYRLRGRLSSGVLGGASFSDAGEVDLSNLAPR